MFEPSNPTCRVPSRSNFVRSILPSVCKGPPAPCPIPATTSAYLRRLSADWLYPVSRPPIRDGAVLIGADGRLVAVGPDAEVPTPPGIPSEDFPGGILMPGLVNAHTHLELTGLGDPVDEDEFPRWIRHVRSLKETRSRDEYLKAAGQGLEACFAAGVTTVAETGDTGVVAEALTAHGGRGVVFQEVFGPHPDQATSAIEQLQQSLSALQVWASEAIRVGVSPHAPYTVSGPLYQKVAELGFAGHLPMAVHIAESIAEQQFLATGTGPFHDAWHRRGIPMPDPPGDTPLGWLERHGVLSPGVLCIHAVQCDEADIDRLVRHRCTVAHCPRSNRRHGHGDAPLLDLLQAGVPVGLGTDSELSLAPMDLLAEARLARELAGLGADSAIELATLGSARAIGWGDAIGALETGRWGDVVVRRIEDVAGGDQLSEGLLQSGPETVVLTAVAGVDRYRLA